MLITTDREGSTPEVRRQDFLDYLRGMAAILMIANHGGYGLLRPEQLNHSVIGLIVFVGSMAPALFFLTVGFGIGYSNKSSSANNLISSTLPKVFLLLLADLFFRRGRIDEFEIDFFGFIGLMTLILTTFRTFKISSMMLIVLGVLAFAIRYLIGPSMRDVFTYHIIDWIVGYNAIIGISYPLTPWIIYGIVGMFLGQSKSFSEHQLLVKLRISFKYGSLASGAILVFISLLITHGGREYFRWGTVSISFFILSLAVLIFSWRLAKGLSCLNGRGTRWVKLRGTASLLVVPVHYGLLEILKPHALPGILDWTFIAVLAALIAVSFLAAKSIERLCNGVAVGHFSFVVIPLAAAAAAGLALYLSFGGLGGIRLSVTSFVGQVLAALLLACLAAKPDRKGRQGPDRHHQASPPQRLDPS